MYYRVLSKLRSIPDAHSFGFESDLDFQKVLRRIVLTHGGDVGECRTRRNDLLLLRFRDPLTGQHSDEWVPDFCCTPSAPPLGTDELEADDPLAGILGIGW